MRKEWKLPARDGRDVENIANKPSAVNTETGKNKKLSFFDAIPILKQGSEVAIDTLLTKFGLRENGNSSRFDKSVHTKGILRQHKAWHAYGGFQDETEALTINSDTWTLITNAGNNLWVELEGYGISIVADEIVIENTGDYVGTLSITFEGGQGKDYLYRIYNTTQSKQEGYHVGTAGAGNGNYINTAIPMYIEATAGDVLQFQVFSLDGTDATYINAIFYINYLHD